MSTNPIWIAGYGGTPIGGASPVWIAAYGAAVAGASEAWIAGYGGTPAGGASSVWVKGYGGTPTGGASPIWIGGYITGSGGGAPTHSAEALAYLARTVGGNEGGNGANIATLIDGLVSDGVWAKLDALYVLAQQNATDSLLNLVGTSYSLTVGFGSPVFTTYVGYSFPTGGSYFDTNFNTSTAPSPKYTQNSASFGVWSYAVVTENFAVMGNGAAGAASILYPSFSGSAFYARVNDSTAGSVPTPGSKGVFAGDRSSSANVVPYWNGVSQGAVTSTSGAPINGDFAIGSVGAALLRGAASPRTTAQTLCAVFIGASLGASGQLALYTRLRTYMTSVGVP